MRRLLSQRPVVFFEQYGGYDEHSEVGQVSTLLAIDLSCFQHYDYGTEDEREEQQYWQDLDPFMAKVAEFIQKIEQNPDYHRSVKHGRHPRESLAWIMRDILQGDEAGSSESANSDANLYPPDHGYLSSGELKEDLGRLKATLDCFKKSGVKKIKLVYS